MRVLDEEWRPGYAEYYCHSCQVTIQVELWLRLSTVEDLYIVPERSIRTVFQYWRVHGIRAVARKVRSRLKERSRNRKYVAFGLGRIWEVGSGVDNKFVVGDRVAFLAPRHPACVEQVSLAGELVIPWPFAERGDDSGRILYEGDLPGRADAVAPFAGWSEFSGEELDQGAVGRLVRALAKSVDSDRSSVNLRARTTDPDVEACVRGKRSPSKGRSSAVLFGYGHYAKNIVLPRVQNSLDVICIHEVDPVQVGRCQDAPCKVRTSAYPEPTEQRYDAYLVCGWHHTHAAIAVHALGLGSAAVVEKPVVTRESQLEQLLQAMEVGQGRVFPAFQRRYSPLNTLALEDLGVENQTPIHLHCLAYEIPLPERHWYRWPNSGSRVLSNGCHWIDYFLYLNRFPEVLKVNTFCLSNGDVVVLMDADNGAGFSLTLTSHGSPRLGVRDVVQLRSGDRTVTIVDQGEYRAENRERCVRTASIPPLKAYDNMYREIGRAIVQGDDGDDRRSLRVSCATILEAERKLQSSMEQENG